MDGLARKPNVSEDYMASPDIKRAFRAVDTAQVDEAISAATNRIAAIELSLAERNQTIARLKREIADPMSATPSFSKLGSTFEETLRSAEDQARRLRSDATAEVATIDEETRLLNEAAAKEISSILTAAKAYAEQTTREADEHTAESYKRADDVAKETDNYVSSSQSRAAKVLDEARARSEQALAHVEKITGEISASSQDFVANMTRDLEDRVEKARRNLEDISGFLYTIRMLTNGFDLGEVSVARSQMATDRSNTNVSIAELLED